MVEDFLPEPAHDGKLRRDGYIEAVLVPLTSGRVRLRMVIFFVCGVWIFAGIGLLFAAFRARCTSLNLRRRERALRDGDHFQNFELARQHRERIPELFHLAY